MNVRVFADDAALAEAAVADLVACSRAAIVARGRFELAVSGGRTPATLFARLASGPMRAALDVAHTHIWFADERAVPPDDAGSNYRMVRESLTGPLAIPAANVHRMEGEREDLARAAADYARALPARFDLIVLGIGEDGHTASLFPGSSLVDEHARMVAVVFDSPKPPSRRLTLTPPVLEAARQVLVLASGEGKAAAVARALAAEGDPHAVPSRLVRERDWYLDAAAARGLGPRAG